MVQETLFGELVETRENTELNAVNSSDYDSWVAKFDAPKTTDDCYTPPTIMRIISKWVAKRYNLDERDFVRPFYPGGDYDHVDYPPECTIVDNPPFSILADIKRFYLKRGIRFFLFCPALTAFSVRTQNVTVIFTGEAIVYDNNAKVMTAFCTNLTPGIIAETAPDLGERIREENARLRAAKRRDLLKYEHPNEIITGAQLSLLARYGVNFAIPAASAAFISKADNKPGGRGIYGGGLILSEKLTVERERAERERAERERAERERERAEREKKLTYFLSERERKIQAHLN